MNLRLRRHYSRLILACTVPLTLVVLALIVFQYHTQRANELVDLRQMASGQRLALNQILGAARDHVELLRRWSEQNLLAPAAAGSPRPGDPIEAGMVEDLYRLIELTHPLTPVLDRSYFFSAGGDPVALYPPLPHWQTEPGAHLDRATLHGYGAFRKVEPAANPLRRGRWNVPEHDAIDPGLMLSYAEPVYRGDTFVGAVVVDLRLEFLTGLLRSMHYPAGRLWLIDNNGRVLTDTRAVHARGGWAPTGAPPDSWTELDASPHGHFQPLADQQLLVLPLGDAPWTLLYAISERELKNLLLPRLLPYGIILAGLCLTLFLTQWLLRRRFINPALALINYIGQADDRAPPPTPRVPALWQPWLDIIATTFRNNRAYLQQLSESDALKTAIIASALDAVIAIDERSAIIEFNPSAERMFGYRRDQVLGRSLAEVILPSANRGRCDCEASRCLDTTDLRLLGKRNELVAIRADGSRFPVEIALAEVKLAERRLFTAYIRDLSQQKQAELEIARQREMLLQSEKLGALGSLLAGVAHELNNPLSIVVGRAHMLESETANSQFAGSIRKIREAAERCARIVKTFVSIARQRPPNPGQVQLNSLIESVVEMLGYGLRKHGIELELRLQADLPPIQADGDQLSQVLMNLVVNAQQALQAHDGPARLLIGTQYDPAGQQVRIRVSDNGPGIPAELRSRIFEPFYTTKGPGIGLGAGLSVSHAIIHSHHGVLSADTNPDGGASFTITLPVAGERIVGATAAEPQRLSRNG